MGSLTSGCSATVWRFPQILSWGLRCVNAGADKRLMHLNESRLKGWSTIQVQHRSDVLLARRRDKRSQLAIVLLKNELLLVDTSRSRILLLLERSNTATCTALKPNTLHHGLQGDLLDGNAVSIAVIIKVIDVVKFKILSRFLKNRSRRPLLDHYRGRSPIRKLDHLLGTMMR